MALFHGADAEILEEGNPEKVLNLLLGECKKYPFKHKLKKFLIFS